MSLDEHVRPSDLVAASRDFIDDPSDDNRWRVVRAMDYPLRRVDQEECATLDALMRHVLAGTVDDVDNTLQMIAWCDMKLQPTGELRLVDNFDAGTDGDPALAELSAERPPPVDQDEADIAYRVRTLRLNDEARTRWNAERNYSGIPEALDVAAVIRGEVDPLRATMLTRTDHVSLIYPGLLHWIYSPPEHAKTWIALHAAAQLLGGGGHVGYLDWEGNRRIVGDRLANIGVTAEQSAGFHYYNPGNLEPQTDWLAAQACDAWHLCIFDGAAKAIAAAGRNENDTPDVLAWLNAVVTPLTVGGCAVLMLDHVTKDPDGRAQARGSGAKGGEASATWELRMGHPFNRRQAGFVKMVQRKDREGWAGVTGDVVAELHLTPTRGHLALELRPPARNAVELARAASMEKAWKAVDAWTAANNGTPPGTNDVQKVTGIDKKRLTGLLDELAELGHVAVTRGGAGRSNVWRPVSPYRAPAPEPPPSALTLSNEEWDVLHGE